MIADSHILAAIEQHGSQRRAATALGLDRRTVERRMARMNREPDHPRTLVFDIETRPLTAYVWGIWQQNIGINQIIDSGGMLCFAAKWTDEDTTQFYSERQGRDRMLRAAWRLLNEADAVVGWNSQRFDTRWMHSEFVREGMRKPTPCKQIDVMKSVKALQYLPSYKLDYSARNLGVGGKVHTGGFDLWRGCMDGDRESWALMEEYNRADVELTERVFNKLRDGGWIKGLPNLSMDEGHVCPNCGSDSLHAHKPYRAETRRYALWVCDDCGTASRSTKADPARAHLKAVA